MPQQCTHAVKAKRAALAQAACGEMHRAFLESCVGQTLPVLFETEADGRWTGHSDTYVLVSAEGEQLRNQLLNVRITETAGDGLAGVII